MEKCTFTHARFHDVIEEVERRFYTFGGEYDEREFDSDWFDFINGGSIDLSGDSFHFEINENAKGLYGLISRVLIDNGFTSSQSVYLDLVNWF